MESPEAGGQDGAAIGLVLSELKLAHAALDVAEVATEAEVRRNGLSMSRKAHTLATRYLASPGPSDEERRSLQAQLRWLEVRLEKLSHEDSGRAIVA